METEYSSYRLGLTEEGQLATGVAPGLGRKRHG